MTSHVRIERICADPLAPQGASKLCGLCRVEELFTDRVCHRPTSMLSIEAILACGFCERCGGAINWARENTASDPRLAAAFRDGRDSARADEERRDYCELVDLGYSPSEARHFLLGRGSAES